MEDNDNRFTKYESSQIGGDEHLMINDNDYSSVTVFQNIFSNQHHHYVPYIASNYLTGEDPTFLHNSAINASNFRTGYTSFDCGSGSMHNFKRNNVETSMSNRHSRCSYEAQNETMYSSLAPVNNYNVNINSVALPTGGICANFNCYTDLNQNPGSLNDANDPLLHRNFIPIHHQQTQIPDISAQSDQYINNDEFYGYVPQKVEQSGMMREQRSQFTKKGTRVRAPRQIYTKQQLEVLNKQFARNIYIDLEVRSQLATQLGVSQGQMDKDFKDLIDSCIPQNYTLTPSGMEILLKTGKSQLLYSGHPSDTLVINSSDEEAAKKQSDALADTRTIPSSSKIPPKHPRNSSDTTTNNQEKSPSSAEENFSSQTWVSYSPTRKDSTPFGSLKPCSTAESTPTHEPSASIPPTMNKANLNDSERGKGDGTRWIWGDDPKLKLSCEVWDIEMGLIERPTFIKDEEDESAKNYIFFDLRKGSILGNPKEYCGSPKHDKFVQKSNEKAPRIKRNEGKTGNEERKRKKELKSDNTPEASKRKRKDKTDKKINQADRTNAAVNTRECNTAKPKGRKRRIASEHPPKKL